MSITRAARVLCLVGLLALTLQSALEVAAQYEYDYDYGYDSYYYDDEDYGFLDDYGYYLDDDEAYYEYYGYYADDYGSEFYDDYADYYYDYYYDEYDYGYGGAPSCTMDGDKLVLADGTAPCDLKIEGVDKQADLLKGGLDGVYKISSCFNGKPLYKRQNSPAGEDRALWFSTNFGDWDVSKGTVPDESEILLYGGEIERASVPLFVTNWHLGADLKSNTSAGMDDYFPIALTIKCADGKVYDAETFNPSKLASGPVLTDDEIEAKYRYIYDKYGRRPDADPTVSLSFVIMLFMVGVTVVLIIPYFLLRRKGQPPAAGSFAHMIQQSKKKSSGHIN